MTSPHAQARIMSHNDAILYRCRGHRRQARAGPEPGRTSGHWAADMVRELVDGPERQRLPVCQHARASARTSVSEPERRPTGSKKGDRLIDSGWRPSWRREGRSDLGEKHESVG